MLARRTACIQYQGRCSIGRQRHRKLRELRRTGREPRPMTGKPLQPPGKRTMALFNRKPRPPRELVFTPLAASEYNEAGSRQGTARPSRNPSSADLHSAVSPICNRQGLGTDWLSDAGERHAECNSAIRQIKNLRYGKSSRNAMKFGDSTARCDTNLTNWHESLQKDGRLAFGRRGRRNPGAQRATRAAPLRLAPPPAATNLCSAPDSLTLIGGSSRLTVIRSFRFVCQAGMVGRVTPCAPNPECNQRRARSDAPYPNSHKTRVLSPKCPHGSNNGRTDGKIAARTERLPARSGRLPAQVVKSSHGMENGRTNGRIAARKWKLSAQIGKSSARNDFSSHESIRPRSSAATKTGQARAKHDNSMSIRFLI